MVVARSCKVLDFGDHTRKTWNWISMLNSRITLKTHPEHNQGRLNTKATESSEGTTLKVEFKAGKTLQEEIEHALATGKNHVREGNKVYLLTKELKEKVNSYRNELMEIYIFLYFPNFLALLKSTRWPQLKNSFCLLIHSLNLPRNGKKKWCTKNLSSLTPLPLLKISINY